MKACVESDPEITKKKTEKAQEDFALLLDSKRWIVLNPRTGQLATQMWIQKYLKSDAAGKPILKDDKSKVKPWVMVFHCKSHEGETILHLQRDPAKNKQLVRCIDLTDKKERSNLAFFMQGYSHFLSGEDDEDEDGDGDGSDSGDSMINDAEGLEGWGTTL